MQFTLDIAPGTRESALGGGLEGAERTSRETMLWDAPIISPDRQINPIKDEADARARDVVQNDGYAAGAVTTHKDSIVGSQFRLNAQPDSTLLGTDEVWAEEFQAATESEFNLLGDSVEHWFDASRMHTFTGLIRLAVGGHVMTGEVLATCEWLRQSARPFRTGIQMISPTRLSNKDGAMDSQTLRRGVTLSEFGEPISYSIRVNHPTDWYLQNGGSYWRDIPARKPWGRRQVIHLFDQLLPSQNRGISDMVSVLKQMRMTKKFQDVTLQNAVVNATYAAAVESELPSDMIFASMGAGGAGVGGVLGQYMTALESYVGGSKNIGIDGVKMPHLFPGTKLNLKPMGTPGGVGSGFEESLLRHTAAALGLSYEQFSHDYTKTNYSSARASMGETWKYMQARKKAVADQFATMIYLLWLEERINAKAVPLPPGFTLDTFYNDVVKREALCACDWIGASRGQIDEMKETQAALMRIKGGLSTWEIETGRLGQDWRRIYRQQARERKMAKELELEFALDATKSGANEAQATMKDNKAEGQGNASSQGDDE